MLGGAILKVSLTHEKTAFAYINPKYRSNNEQNQCIQVVNKDRTILLWVVYSSNIPEGQMAVNPLHAGLIGLEEGSEVFVCPYEDAKVIDELYVEADSAEDQEILEYNQLSLQIQILDQLRLVFENQKAVVWISPSMPIVFTPKKTGILVNQSKILVKIDAFNNFQGPKITTPEPTTNNLHNIGLINNNMLQPYLAVPERRVLRAVPIDSDGKKNLIHPYTVFIHEDSLEKYKDLTVIMATMIKIPKVQTESDENEICVEIFPVNSVVFRSLCREVYNKNIPTVLIPKSLNAIIKVWNGLRVVLTIIGDKSEQPEHIDIITYSDPVQTELGVIERFKNCVIESTHSGKKFLINDNLIKQNAQISAGYLQLKLKPEKLKFTMLNSESFRHCTIAAKCLTLADLQLPSPDLDDDDCSKDYCRTMKSMEALVEKILSHLYFEIHREANFKGVSEIKSNVLVTGVSGTGKSALCRMVQKELTVYSLVIRCRSLKGRKDFLDSISSSIEKCQERSPAVLICDDFDALVPAETEGGSPQDVAYYQRQAMTLKKLLQSCENVAILVTSLSMNNLHPVLQQFGGKPLFTAHFDIPELDQSERAELFKYLLNDKIRSEFEVTDDDVTKMAVDTAGNSIRDVSDYLNRKIFKAVKKKKSETHVTRLRLVEEVTKDEETASAFDVWGPVGGLDDVKRELTECIFWPLMYPALFPSQSCGVLLYGPPGTGKSLIGSCLARLAMSIIVYPALFPSQSCGVLLYGPPGTGKSLIGSCLARLANMSIIVVKGPELLSKYIGQSEKAVRDVFDKADMKRPCILFFDEFDSLAPKRGHDSTGVTDRVVNQLLARMDGAEGGARGPVIAATSRPDLVDPALLRPGRLQRHVYCALPDERGRHEVLQTLSSSVALDPSIDLQELARNTDGFSPADLKSLLVTAQLARLEIQLLEHNEDKELESVVVTQEDIDNALEETKPSLSMEQRRFYDTIYRRFRGESLQPEQQRMMADMQKQRVTLA